MEEPKTVRDGTKGSPQTESGVQSVGSVTGALTKVWKASWTVRCLRCWEENGTAKRDAQCSVERDKERTGGAELREEQVVTPHGPQNPQHEGCSWVAGRRGE